MDLPRAQFRERVTRKWHLELDSECVVCTQRGCLSLKDFGKWRWLGKHPNSEFQNPSTFSTEQIQKKHQADLRAIQASVGLVPKTTLTLIACLILSG